MIAFYLNGEYIKIKILLVYKSKKDSKDPESIQLSTTPDPGYHKGNKNHN